jgi:ribonuclease HII
MWSFETNARGNGFSRIAGVDEAGRGPLAGPVVSAAVILSAGFSGDESMAPYLSEINDSKKLTPRKRDILYESIYRHAAGVGVGMVDAEEIDRINILQAALCSMVLAVKDLALKPDYVLIDGNFPIPMDLPQESIVKGDAKSVSIAAASIIAKVTRDRLMEGYHRQYPQYGFSGHKGYPTKAHRLAIASHGPSPIHRKTFKGVREHVE